MSLYQELKKVKDYCESVECDNCKYYMKHCCSFAKILDYTIPKYWDLDDFPEELKND